MRSKMDSQGKLQLSSLRLTSWQQPKCSPLTRTFRHFASLSDCASTRDVQIFLVHHNKAHWYTVKGGEGTLQSPLQ